MKNFIARRALAAALGGLLLSVLPVLAQGTAFTYQGQLNAGGSPANGLYDFQFALSNAPSAGSQIGSTVTALALGVTNGLFSTNLDFGAVFTGNPTWLAISVRSNSLGSYTALTPLQELSPVPYAIFANTASNLSGQVPLAQLPATVSLLSDPGSLNFFAGQYAGNGSMTGAANTGVGDSALGYNSLGAYNAAQGYFALYDNGAGSFNTANGAFALEYNTTGSNNTGTGAYALSAYNVPQFVIGSDNTADGAYALAGDESGYNNTAVGFQALFNNTSGFYNTALGFNAGISITGNSNIDIGNPGLSSDNLVIRIGNGQTQTFIDGVITGNGGGLTNLNASQLTGNRLLLTSGTDTNNGLQYATSGLIGVPGGGAGPFLFGYNGGALGTVNPTEINLSWDFSGNVWVSNNLSTEMLNIDRLGSNSGYLNQNGLRGAGLTFGIGSGEGIASQRTTNAPNQYDLAFYTAFTPRMTILQDGYVGIGTTNPTSQLDVNGDARIDNNRLLLTSGGDTANGLQYATSGLIGVPGGGAGPFLFGYNGGALGTVGPTEINLSWDYSGNVWVSNNLSTATLTIRGGADLAEPFKITPGNVEVPQGAVVVIDEENPGHLKVSSQPYDTRVAGVLSGANGVNPGIQMQQQGLIEGGKNVALTGRVYVQADTSNGAIKPGDLLTTSATPGRAMKVTDHARASGAILGKAMTGLSEGKGLVLVLVTLQ